MEKLWLVLLIQLYISILCNRIINDYLCINQKDEDMKKLSVEILKKLILEAINAGYHHTGDII